MGIPNKISYGKYMVNLWCLYPTRGFFVGGLPGLVNIQKAIEHGHLYIVSFPINSMVDLSIVFCKRLPEGKHQRANLWWFNEKKKLDSGNMDEWVCLYGLHVWPTSYANLVRKMIRLFHSLVESMGMKLDPI